MTDLFLVEWKVSHDKRRVVVRATDSDQALTFLHDLYAEGGGPTNNLSMAPITIEESAALHCPHLNADQTPLC